jgi:predicted phosphodiesterase
MRIGILTDIHENVQMLHEALRQAAASRCDELACLGDIVGYDRRFYRFADRRSARECVALIRANFRWVVAGNHDLHASGRVPSWSNGFRFPEGWFAMDALQRKAVSGGKVWCYEGDDPNDLEDGDLEYLCSLPEYETVEADSATCLFSHYIFPDFTGSTTRYFERKWQLKPHWEFMNQNSLKYSFSGHSHQLFAGFAYPKAGLIFRAIQPNPNSRFTLGGEMQLVTLPPLAGDHGRTGFSVFDTQSRILTIHSLRTQ